MRRAAGVLALALACGGGDKVAVNVEAIALTDGRLGELAGARRTLLAALEEDRTNGAALAGIAEVDGLSALIYGIPIPEERVFAPVVAGAPRYRSWVVGKVAFELTRTTRPEQLDAISALIESQDPSDRWVRWLGARIALLRGDVLGANERLGANELSVSALDRAMQAADENSLDAASQLLARTQHDLVPLLQAILDLERGDLAASATHLEAVTIDAPRVTAYRLLASVLLGLASERYTLVDEALGKLGRIRSLPNECWMWERIAWAHLQLGRSVDRTNDHKIASIARTHCAALGKATGANPRLVIVDAMLQLGLGRPEQADEVARRSTSEWARVLRAYALLELGRPADVATLFEAKPPAQAPLRRATKIVQLQARIQLSAGKARAEAISELDAVADAGGDQRARYALGAAYVALGDLTAAKRELRRVVEETSAERPDPFAFRTHQLLAEIAMAGHDLDTVGPEIERAIAIHPGNQLSYVIQARVLIARGEAERALATMAPVRKLGDLIPAGKLVVAEALASVKNATTDQRAQARALVLEVKDKLPPAEVGRVAALIDPTLPRELGLPVGKPPKQGT